MSDPRAFDPSSVDPARDAARANAAVAAAIDRYWRRNLRIMGCHLAVWAVAGLGCGVVFAEDLNHVRLGGIPLGFWFAQQGSVLVFVMVIFSYAAILNRMDARHQQELDRLSEPRPPR